MSQDLAALLHRLRKTTVIRYGLASVAALAVDMGSFLALLALGLAPTIASALAYTLGIGCHWILSSRKVFADSVAAGGAERYRQKALFFISALLGLALTTAIVGTGSALALDPRLAKLIAIVASFTLTWVLRNRIVFRAAGGPG